MPRVKSAIRNRARLMRAESTPAERKPWQILRRRQLYGWHFRRQHPIPPYFADFACLAARLVVEADGGQHDPDGHDRVRDAKISAVGWRILRFGNKEILQNPEGVYQAILGALGAPSPSRSPLPTLPRFAEEGEPPATCGATLLHSD
ncbi:MAG: endonuclease domain-containing protein [Dongiaceae bacterium]